jgi:ABC-type dipeptide/oligopeptide/nickel transport system permease component/ABC-type dipeptide/oligopeptide/nickel transport system permease subunit
MSVPIRDIARKTLSIFLAIIMILTVNFCLFYVLLGDPHNVFNSKTASPGLRDLRIERFHLDDPIYLQYFHYIADTLTGDLRTSIYLGGTAEISDFIWDSMWFTLLLFVTIASLSIAFGVLLEYLALRTRSRVPGHAVHILSLVLLSIPVFSLGILLLLLSIEVDTGLPLGGNGTERADEGIGMVTSILQHLLLPALIGVLATVGMLVLLARAGISELACTNRILKEEAHQISRRKSIFLGLFLIRPFLQFFLALTMSCVLTIEALLSYGGLGERIWTAVNYRDFSLMMACFFVISMIVLAADIVASGILSLARGAKFHDLAVGWVHHERGSKKAQRIQRASTSRRTALFEFAKKMWKGYNGSTLGMLALLALIVLIAAGALAPFLSTVDDPTSLRSLDGRNLPPSFERSPTTGWLHPLGTDHHGRDVYSMWLFAARHTVLDVLSIALGAVLIGVLVGVAASKTTRINEHVAGLLDFLLTIPARAFLAIPFYVLVLAAFLMGAMAGHRWTNASSVFLILGIYSWAWVVLARRVRAHARARSGVESEIEVIVSSRVMLPAILSSTLLVAKFAVVASLIWQASSDFLGIGSRSDTWTGMLNDAYAYDAFLGDDWHLILPPILGLFLVTASVFVILDRLEAVANNIEAEPNPDSEGIAVPETDAAS